MQEAKFFPELISAISSERFYAYRRDLQDSDSDILARYLWNIELSESLYPTINIFEIALRNNIYFAFQKTFDTKWLHGIGPQILQQNDIDIINKVKNDLTRKSGQLPSDPQIVAQLTFGFWATLFNSKYHVSIWHKVFSRSARHQNNIFPNAKRSDLSIKAIRRRVERVRKLRNRISHHRSIIQPDELRNNVLKQKYDEMVEMISWIHSPMSEMAQDISRFHEVYNSGSKYYLDLIAKHVRQD